MAREHDHPLTILRVFQAICSIPAIILFFVCKHDEGKNRFKTYVNEGNTQLFAGIALLVSLIYGILTAFCVRATTRRWILILLLILDLLIFGLLVTASSFVERFNREYGYWNFSNDPSDGRRTACDLTWSDMGFENEDDCLGFQNKIVKMEIAASVLLQVVMLLHLITVGWLAKSIYDFGYERRSKRRHSTGRP